MVWQRLLDSTLTATGDRAQHQRNQNFAPWCPRVCRSWSKHRHVAAHFSSATRNPTFNISTSTTMGAILLGNVDFASSRRAASTFIIDSLAATGTTTCNGACSLPWIRLRLRV